MPYGYISFPGKCLAMPCFPPRDMPAALLPTWIGGVTPGAGGKMAGHVMRMQCGYGWPSLTDTPVTIELNNCIYTYII